MIYLVEDNDALRESIILMIKDFAQADVAGSGSTEEAATEWLLSHSADWKLAVVDLFLLQGSGLGVLTSCRDRKPDQKIVVLTNYATADIRRRALALGADAVFDKSTELDAFLAYCANYAASANSAP